MFLHNDDLQSKFAQYFLLMSDANSSATLPDDVTLMGSEEDVQWRNWVLARFNDYVLRCPNTTLNLVAGTLFARLEYVSVCLLVNYFP